jgi:hypothetical protein
MRIAAGLKEGIEGLLRRFPGRLRRRHLLLPCILLVQLLLLTLLSLNPAPIAALAAPSPPMSLFDVRSPAATPLPAKPKPKPVVSPTPPRIELPVETVTLPAEPVFSAAAAESAGFGTSCDISETLARAFSENQFVQAELARIGPRSRSVANAIMFWDGGWVELPGDAPAEALETLRRAILEGVRAAPPECRIEDLRGPRFISVSSEGATTMLVLGSGAWRWEQLLAEVPQKISSVEQQGRNN